MLTPQDLHGVMGMMPSFATPDAGDLNSTATIDVDNMQAGIDKMIKDGINVITTTGSFGECYNLFFDEWKTLAVAALEATNKRVPLMIGTTSANPREVVQRMKFLKEIGADGTLLGVPYYDEQSQQYIGEFYTQIADMFPELGIMIYHNPPNHKVHIAVNTFKKIVESPNIIGMKDSHHETRQFIQLQKIVKDKISIFVNQGQYFPFARLGAAGCWSIDAWLGPWPVLHLRNLLERGEDEAAVALIGEIMGDGGGGRPDPSEGNAGFLGHELAGYVNPGPTRTPILKQTDALRERTQKRVDRWKALCDKYRPLVEAEQQVVAV